MFCTVSVMLPMSRAVMECGGSGKLLRKTFALLQGDQHCNTFMILSRYWHFVNVIQTNSSSPFVRWYIGF